MNLKIFFLSLLLFSCRPLHARCNGPGPLWQCSHFSTFWWNEGNTPLHIAVMDNDRVSAQKLLKMGAAVDTRNDRGKTPLFYAVQFRHIEMAKLLIEHNANPLIRDIDGATALNRIVQFPQDEPRQDHDIIQLLLSSSGFNPDNTCENQDIALAATNNFIGFFQKSTGTIATYIPTLHGNDGFGNHRIQTLTEDNIYPDTIRVVLDLEWDHELQAIQGSLIFDNFQKKDSFITMTNLKIKNLNCPWKKWEYFLASTLYLKH